MKKQIKYGIIHIHSENSLKDSALKMPDLVARAAELGAPAIVLTDHGTLTGVEDFRAEVSKYNKIHGTNIKCIPGVEAYVEEDGEDISRRCHLILIPMDFKGFKAISKAVTESNHRLDSQSIPRMNIEILNRYFGKGGEGHRHVIATSACAGGILASLLNQNFFIQEQIEKLSRKQSALCNPYDDEALDQEKFIAITEARIAEISEEIKRLTPISKKPYTKKENTLKKFIGTPDYDELFRALETEKAETRDAAERIKALRELREIKRDELRPVKQDRDSKLPSQARWLAIEEQIGTLCDAISSRDELYRKTRQRALKYVDIFGVGNFYIELQYHGLDIEANTMPTLASIARELEIPIVAANDAHMAGNSEDELMARQIMRSLRFNKWEERSPGDAELYIKTDEELATSLSQILPRDIVDRAMEGIDSIISACNVVFPENESHYPVFDAPEGAGQRLRNLCAAGIKWRYPDKEKWTPTHQKRMEYELEIIDKLGYNDYLCIVEDFLRYGRLLGKIDMKNPDPRYLADPYNMELLAEITADSVGLGIGSGRGSGVGSLVNYLIGITGIDPIEHELYFERFLNVERVSPPDIDSDIASEIRDKVIDYIKHKYGEEAVCCIMTKTKQQAKAAIRACARLLGSERFNNTATFLDLGDEICKSLPNELDIKLNACLPSLTQKYGDDEAAMTIINRALLVEDVFVNIGMHAAGVIIADNGDVKEYVPLCYIPGKGQFATQYDKVQSEKLGLLKMDALGLKNLDVITHTLRLIKQRYDINIDIERIPMEAEVFENIFATGNTDAVFQFESPGMKELLRRFRPEKIQHITLLNAMYRPGPIQFIDDVVAVKSGEKKPDYVIPEMKDVLGDTYGYPIFQEQLMSIFNKYAGFSLGEADIIRRAMSKKHIEEFIIYKDKFIDGIVAKGGKPADVEAFWDKLLKFSAYAFNKSHSCAYSYVAYYTAWLKYHYPKEYLCAVLNATALDKIPRVIQNCRSTGIKILPPDVNLSNSEFSINNQGIVYGLERIKSVGNQIAGCIIERKTGGKYISLADFIMRTRIGRGTTETLIKAGAFDFVSPNRDALLASLDQYYAILTKIKTQENKLFTPHDDTVKYEQISEKLRALINQFYGVSIDEAVRQDIKARLLAEKELLGSFISSNPLDSYEKPEGETLISIDSLNASGFVHIYGLISNLKIVRRKKDGKEMAFFTLEDETGSINVSCFARQYGIYREIIKPDTAIQVKGTCRISEDNASMAEDDGGVTKEIILDSAFAVSERKNNVVFYVKSMMDWADNVRPRIEPYISEDGSPLILYDMLTGQFRKTTLRVSGDVANYKTKE